MGKIICLMGKSSSGKDTIYKNLLQEKDVTFYRIIPYTTRPIRSGETDGVEYYFTDNAGLAKLCAEQKVIEQRAYHTVYGVWNYFTVDDGQIDLSKGNYLLIGTLEAYIRLKEHYGNEAVLPIYIEVDDGLRLERALQRERHQLQPKYAEMCRRFLADEEDFSEEKLTEAGITKRFVNEGLATVISQILEYISQNT